MFVQRLPFRLFLAHATHIHSYPIYWAKVYCVIPRPFNRGLNELGSCIT